MIVDVVKRRLVERAHALRVVQPDNRLTAHRGPQVGRDLRIVVAYGGVQDLLAAVGGEVLVVENGRIEEQTNLEWMALLIELLERLDHGWQPLGGKQIQLRR